MASRSIWKGSLKIGTTRIPVKLFSAVQDRTIHFHVLERRTLRRIRQQMVNPDTGDEVAPEDVRRGYEVEEGVFVVLNDKELARFDPKPSRDIEILQFTSPSEISDQFYERPYWLAPDSESKNYFAFAQALQSENKAGVAHWVMRGKEYVGAVRFQDGYLALVTLRYSEEVLSPRELQAAPIKGVSQGELRMAEQLVHALQSDFRPEDFHDDYREQLMQFIKAKADGHKPRLQRSRRRRQKGPLMDQLAKSLKAAEREHEKKAA